MATFDEQCGNCLDVAKEAVETDCCGQLFCQDCLTPLEGQPCPRCQTDPIAFRPNMFARAAIDKARIPCPNGCPELVTSGSLPCHLENCEKRIYTCCGPDCEFTGDRDELCKHLAAEHARHLAKSMERIFKNDKGEPKVKPIAEFSTRVEKPTKNHPKLLGSFSALPPRLCIM